MNEILLFLIEICEFDEIDNRYEKSIMLLNRHLNTKIETYKIKRPELIDVQRFDEFYDDFENIHFQEIQNLE